MVLGTTNKAVGPPLHFVACAFDAQGPLFTLAGEPLHQIIIEVSTNLSSWAPLATNSTDAQGINLFRHQYPGSSPHQFYRARLGP